jgi:hypothetical protein
MPVITEHINIALADSKYAQIATTAELAKRTIPMASRMEFIHDFKMYFINLIFKLLAFMVQSLEP